MSGGETVLERNLRLLLQRAYEPAVPRPSFRAQLERDLVARALARHARPAPALLRPVWLAAAAAVAALLGALAWRAWPGATPGPDAILARGAPALLEPLEGGTWRPLEGPLVWSGSALELRTPEQAAAALSVDGGSLELGRASALVLAPQGEGVRARLLAGILRVEGEDLRAPADVLLVGGRVARPQEREEPQPVDLAGGREAVASAVEEPPAAPEPEPERASLRGVVRAVPPEGGPPRPLGHFRVLVLRQVSLPRTADARIRDVEDPAGRFAVDVRQAGRYSVFVQAQGFATWRRDGLALEPPGEAPPELEVLLERDAIVEGVVVDQLTGEPVAGAAVVSETDAPVQVLPIAPADLPEHVRRALSGPDGRFVLEGLSPGKHLLRGGGGGRSVGWTEVEDLRPGDRRLGVRIELQPAGRVEGVVEDAQGEPDADAVLIASTTDFGAGRPTLTFQHGEADEQGRYAIDGLPPGVLAVLRFSSDTHPERATPDMRFAQLPPGGTAQVDFRAERTGARLWGRVARADGTPLAGRSIWAAPAGSSGPGDARDWASVTTDDEGRYAFEGLAPGSYELYLSGRTPPDALRIGELEMGRRDRRHDVALPGASLSGRVVAAQTGEPVSFAVVVLWRDAAPEPVFLAKVFSDQEGAYELPFVAPGIYTLDAFPSRPGLATQRIESLAVAEGEQLGDLDFRLAPGGAVRVAVLDEAGAPVPNARVGFRDPSGRSVQLGDSPLADEQGRYQAYALGRGTWTVQASAPGFEPARRELVALPGEVAEVELVLRRAR